MAATIPSYTSSHRPGLTTDQRLISTPDAITPALAAVIVGPKFLLNRYGHETIPGDTFNVGGQTLPFSRYVSGVETELDLDAFTVDQKSVRLYGVGLEAALATIFAADSGSFVVDSLANPNVIRMKDGATVKGAGLNTEFANRPVTVGDIAYCTGINSGTTFRRKVIGLLGAVSAGSFGSNTPGSNGNAGNSSSNPAATTAAATQISAPANWAISKPSGTFNGLARGARYLTQYGELFTITVNTPGAPGTATVNISSASGLFAATNVATTDASGNFAISNTDAGGELAGVNLLLTPTPSASLASGMVFRILVLGNYARLSTTQVVASGTYTGAKDTTYMVRVTGTNSAGTSFTNATIEITDTAGIDAVTQFTLTDNTAVALGAFGLSIKFHGNGAMPSQAGLRVGDIYYVNAVAGAISTANFDKVILDGPAVDTLVFTNVATEIYSVEFRLPFTGEILSTDDATGTAWEASDASLAISASLSTLVEERDTGSQWCYFVNGIGELKPSYRAFYNVDANNEMVAITLPSEIEDAAGAIDLDNDLGFAAQEAFDGSEGETIFVLNTGGDSAEAFAAALDTIENTNQVSYLGLIGDPDVIGSVAKTHIETASSSTVRNVRRGYIGIDSPGKYLALDKKADTTNFTATVSPHGSGNLLFSVVSGASEALLTSRNLVSGDLVEVGGVEYPMASLVSDTEGILLRGPDAPVSPAATLRIFKKDTVASQSAKVIDTAAALGSRRMSLIWTERGTRDINGVPTVIPNRFAAAFIAGLRSFLPPSVGMTRSAVTTFSRTPVMYSRYKGTQLDAVAAAGVMIVAQESKTGGVRIRHQLTTDVAHGILSWEDSVGVRMDALQLETDVLLDSLIGKLNATDDAVGVITAGMINMLDAKRKKGIADSSGPLIDGYANLVVVLDHTLGDRALVTYDVAIGPPLNTIWQTINAFATLP